ncbi:MAG: DUF507 family protein [Nitrospiraceae bacterium]|jgi:hypothetical protein|nr:MAG: DUF507 family protein [Nitrospiraceae bacterium]UCH46116.1 MAG: DUF507 family protein [Nitrospiraceae bacterium]
MSKEIAASLVAKGMVELKVPEKEFTALLEELILDELMVEDRLNAEIREMLKQHEAEIEKGRLDYRKVFDLTKQKILKERNIII